MGSFLHNAAPCCPPCAGTRVLVQLSPKFRGRVSGLCGDFDGDASNDLRSRQGVLEPTAELAAHSWHLSPLCPEPGDLLHPCTVSMGRQGEGRGGQLQETCRGWGEDPEAGCCGRGLVAHGAVPAGERPPGQLGARPLRGAAAVALCPVPWRGAPTAVLRVVCA